MLWLTLTDPQGQPVLVNAERARAISYVQADQVAPYSLIVFDGEDSQPVQETPLEIRGLLHLAPVHSRHPLPALDHPV